MRICLCTLLAVMLLFSLPACSVELHCAQLNAGDGLRLDEGTSFEAGAFDGTRLEGDAVVLSSTAGDAPGSYTSPVIKLSCPASMIVPSWNIRCEKDQGWLVEVQLKEAEGETSPWLYVEGEGISIKGYRKVTGCPWAKVVIDNIVATKPVTAVRYRVFLHGSGSSPSLALFALAFRFSPPDPGSDLDGDLLKKMVSMNVPFRSQKSEAKEISSRICCPTSTSMVLEYLGVNRPTAEIASMLYSREHDLYGIWWRPPQLACQLGLKGWVRLFSTWRDVQHTLSEGQPIIASIAYAKGTLTGAPCPGTKGHIVVITGLTENGDVCVNDPAGASPEKGRVVYNRLEFGKAWFGHGGAGIIIRKRAAES